MKHKDSWPSILEVSREYSLDYENSIILLSLLEMDDEEGNELYKLEAKGKDILGKAQVYAKWLRNRDYHYQNYLKRLSAEDEPFEFSEYILGSRIDILKEHIKTISEEINKGNI